jgi:hypothetical protein
MGGFGSGRFSRSGSKAETDDSMPLDIRRLVRSRLVIPGNCFGWQWLFNDRMFASVTIQIGCDYAIKVSYRRKSTGELFEQRLQTHTSSCNLGGERRWFTCPQCGKRVAVLYAPGRYFACRQCSGLGYPSQKERDGDRATRRMDGLRKRMGWPAGIFHGVGGKPKGMHWKTYHRLRSQHDALLRICLEDLDRELDLIYRLDSR